MDFRATLKFARTSPQKARLIADLVRGKEVEEAVTILKFSPRKAAGIVLKIIESAVANADNRGDVDVDTLFVRTIFVNEGPTLKRFMPRAMGRATRINKRTSHITVVLDEK